MAKKTKKASTQKNINNDLNLQQIGVVITRPENQSATLIQWITEANGTALNIPCLEILDPTDIDNAKHQCTELAKENDYWAFTSPNAVEYAQKFGLDFNANIPCISIGSGTSRLLKSLTTSEIIQADTPFTTEALLDKLSVLDLTDKKISIFSGEGGRRLLENALNSKGAIAQYVDVYRRAIPEHIDLSAVIQYNEKHPIVIFVSSQEAFDAYHAVASKEDPNTLDHTLIVGSERLEAFARSLNYRNIYVASSAISADLWQKLLEILPDLFLPSPDSITEDSSMNQPNDKENLVIAEESSTDVKPVAPEHIEPQQVQPVKPSNSLSYIALALGLVGIGIGAFAFLQTTQESTNTQGLKRTIEQQNTEISTLTQSLNNLKKTVDAERGQSTDFTNLAEAQKQHQQNLTALQQRLGTLDSAISNLQADSGTSTNRYNQLKDHITQFEDVVAKLDQTITQIGKMANDVQSDAVKTQNRLTSQLVDVNSKIGSLTALEKTLEASTDIDLLNLNQAKYLLRLANFKLMYESDPVEATSILNEASERLMATANAKFSETNNLIQSEIVKLKEIHPINYETYATRIQNLINVIPTIDTKSDDILGDLKNSFNTDLKAKEIAEGDPNAKPWYKKAVDKVTPVFIISEERTPAPDLMEITDESLVIQSLQLQLTTARLALLQSQAETYQESLKAARSLLTSYFSPNDDKYHQVLSALNELLNVNLTSDELNITPILKSFDASMLNYRGEGL